MKWHYFTRISAQYLLKSQSPKLDNILNVVSKMAYLQFQPELFTVRYSYFSVTGAKLLKKPFIVMITGQILYLLKA